MYRKFILCAFDWIHLSISVDSSFPRRDVITLQFGVRLTSYSAALRFSPISSKWSKVTWIYIALYHAASLKRSDIWPVCNKGITQLYLPPTHKPYLPLLPSRNWRHRPLAGTHCTYPRRDGQAELTWMVGYIPRSISRTGNWTRTRSPTSVLTGPDVG